MRCDEVKGLSLGQFKQETFERMLSVLKQSEEQKR